MQKVKKFIHKEVDNDLIIFIIVDVFVMETSQ